MTIRIIREDGGGGSGGTGQRSPGGSPPPPTPSPIPITTTPVPPPPILPLTTQRVADALKGGAMDTAPDSTVQGLLAACMSVGTALGLPWTVPAGSSNVEAIGAIRSAILNAFARAEQVAAEASSRGFLLPDDPKPRFDQLNAARRLFDPIAVSDAESRELLTATVDLITVAREHDEGLVAFNRHLPAAQLASFEVSVDGIARQSGDPLVDILGYQPDADFVKRKQALDSLARLDFSKRKPYLLFTADVITGGRRQSGTIVCWLKMRDASGYVLTKRDVFAGVDFIPVVFSAQDAQGSTAALLDDPDFNQVLSFYDWVTKADVTAVVDTSSSPGTLYSYSVSGVQRRAPSNSSFFDVPMGALYLSNAQADSVRSFVAVDSAAIASGSSIDSVSPYPALSRTIYGDPGYGWILAGCNMLGAKRRGDSDDQVRAFSYLGSKASTLLSEAASGRMFVPNDLNQVHSAIDSGVSSFGIAQTVLSVLDGTGVTLFAAKKDDPLGFQPTQQSLESVSAGLARILSAIDPESALVDPAVLAASLSTRVNAATQARYSSTSIPATGSLQLPDAATLATAFGSGVIDLTTYEGISRLMQVIRTVYDFYPGALV